jgi:hypothetical protein
VSSKAGAPSASANPSSKREYRDIIFSRTKNRSKPPAPGGGLQSSHATEG